jgi:hypothetical protein
MSGVPFSCLAHRIVSRNRRGETSKECLVGKPASGAASYRVNRRWGGLQRGHKSVTSHREERLRVGCKGGTGGFV